MDKTKGILKIFFKVIWKILKVFFWIIRQFIFLIGLAVIVLIVAVIIACHLYPELCCDDTKGEVWDNDQKRCRNDCLTWNKEQGCVPLEE